MTQIDLVWVGHDGIRRYQQRKIQSSSAEFQIRQLETWFAERAIAYLIRLDGKISRKVGF